jgi:NAD(P)-dependent dehydrogenase (short-subunit alcohol dehydrogenase family)
MKRGRRPDHQPRRLGGRAAVSDYSRTASEGRRHCLTKALAKALAPEVQVNAVAPGPVMPPDDLGPERAAITRDAAQRFGSLTTAALRRFSRRTPTSPPARSSGRRRRLIA